MSILDLNAVPNVVAMALRGNTGIFQSPLVGSVQTIDRGGFKWIAQYTYTALRDAERAEVFALIAALRGQANRIRLKVADNPKRGAYGGAPLVAGGGQTGQSIDLDGGSFTIANWIRAGDYFSIDVNGEHELKMATADASTDGAGLVTVQFQPRLRASPLDNAVVYVEDSVLPVPRGIFYLTEPETTWSSQPGTTHRSSLSLKMSEDVFATQ